MNMTAERDALMLARTYVALCAYQSETARAHLAQIDAALSQPQAEPVGDWWYVVDKDGFTYRCVDQVDAPIYVDMFNKVCPQKSPYHVVQLYEVAPGVGAAQDGFVMVPRELIERFQEINPSNYNHDDVCQLNAWGVELVLAAAPQPAQTERDEIAKGLAAIAVKLASEQQPFSMPDIPLTELLDIETVQPEAGYWMEPDTLNCIDNETKRLLPKDSVSFTLALYTKPERPELMEAQLDKNYFVLSL